MSVQLVRRPGVLSKFKMIKSLMAFSRGVNADSASFCSILNRTAAFRPSDSRATEREIMTWYAKVSGGMQSECVDIG